MKKIFVQFSIFLFLLNLFWYTEAFESVPIFLYGGTALVAISTAYYINGRCWSEISLPHRVKWWIFFGIYSAITGIVVATDRSILISSLITYFAFLFVLTCIIFLIKGENNIQWLLRQIIFITILCALYTIFRGVDYYNGIIVRTMGPHNNPNTLGALMVFGSFSLLYLSKPQIKTMFRNAIILTLFAYIIILTGSKKALLSEGILICIWVWGFFKGMRQSERLFNRICAYILVAICGGAVVYYFMTYYIDTASFIRMQSLTSSGSTNSRMEMYKEASGMFKTSPLFGIGYNQFRVLSSYGSYSHATYPELIADSGIIGTLIFMYPILITGKKILVGRFYDSRYIKVMLLALYVVEIFLGAMNIFFYEFDHLLMWTILFIESENQGYVRKGRKIQWEN